MKNKNVKKSLALFFAVVFSVALVSCSTDGEDTSPGTTEPFVVTTSCEHEYEDAIIYDPTCTSPGGAVKICIYCKDQEGKLTPVPALGHDYILQKSVESTCLTEGYVDLQCSRCGSQSYETSPALGHAYETDSVVEADCISGGYTLEKCSRCSDTQRRDITAPLGHDYVEISRKEPTELEAGEAISECTRCGERDTVILDKIRKEILFRGIPWGTNSDEAKKLLDDMNPKSNLLISEGSLLPYTECMFDSYPLKNAFGGGNILFCSGFSAGGFDTLNMRLYFSYAIKDGLIDREDDELYAASFTFDVLDHETVFNAIVQQLNGLYGSGNESTTKNKKYVFAWDYSGEYEEKVTEITWSGRNDTAVTLRWVSSDNMAESVQMYCGLEIAYYKTNHDKKLDDIVEALKEEQCEEDRDKAQSGSNEGL